MSPRFIAWIGLACGIVFLDQASKWVVLTNLNYAEPVVVTPFFQLLLIFNPGAAFSFLATQPGWQRWFFIVLAIVICGWLLALLYRHQSERALPLAFSLIIGGAIGNVIDRIVHGAVVDFLFFHAGRYSWPAFNLADAAITVGVILMLWSQLRPAAPEKKR